jgi:very-short-patch-repair endonuclease
MNKKILESIYYKFIIMTKVELIQELNLIKIKDFSIKGGVAHFNRLYPTLLKYINEHTIEMQTFAMNKKLPAKILFLQKYFGKIENIMRDGKLMIFDNKILDFKVANINAAQKQWNSNNTELLGITDLYTKEETILLLRDSYMNYFGKSGNRKLLRDNKKLYLSLYKHTSQLDSLNGNLKKFSSRLYILINNINVYCEIHNVLKFWRVNNGVFKISCGKCVPKYPSSEYFKKKYGTNWKEYENERKSLVIKNKANSLEWFIRKYGDEIGKTKYSDYVTKKMITLSELKANKFSKISQELFWKVYEGLKNKENIYFHDLNSEFVMKIPIKYNHKNTVMMFDFKQNKKIIEYNGKYWHSKEKDTIRYDILRDIGYDIFVVTSDDYNRNNKNNEIIKNCINFLQ